MWRSDFQYVTWSSRMSYILAMGPGQWAKMSGRYGCKEVKFRAFKTYWKPHAKMIFLYKAIQDQTIKKGIGYNKCMGVSTNQYICDATHSFNLIGSHMMFGWVNVQKNTYVVSSPTCRTLFDSVIKSLAFLPVLQSLKTNSPIALVITLFVCLFNMLVPNGKSVSGHMSTHYNRPGHKWPLATYTKFYIQSSIGETRKAYRLPFVVNCKLTIT